MKTPLLLIAFLAIFLMSCNSQKKEKIVINTPEKEELIMYIPSEMTALMREMADFQEESKKQIEKGELPLDFPEKFNKIHSAKLSDQFEHDDSFQSFATMYYQDIKNLGNSTKQNAKENFNTAINTCIACHKTTCHGPITRIKKILIK